MGMKKLDNAKRQFLRENGIAFEELKVDGRIVFMFDLGKLSLEQHIAVLDYNSKTEFRTLSTEEVESRRCRAKDYLA